MFKSKQGGQRLQLPGSILHKLRHIPKLEFQNGIFPILAVVMLTLNNSQNKNAHWNQIRDTTLNRVKYILKNLTRTRSSRQYVHLRV